MSAAPSVLIMSNDRCCAEAGAGMTGGRLAGGGSATGAEVVVTRRTLEPGEKPVQYKQCGQCGYQPSQICSMQHCSVQLQPVAVAAANLPSPSSLVAGCQRLVGV